jgi:hypothetical protein
MRRLRQDMRNMKRGHSGWGMAVSDQEMGFPFDELLSSVATTGRSGIMGLSRVGCRPKLLTDC